MNAAIEVYRIEVVRLVIPSVEPGEWEWMVERREFFRASSMFAPEVCERWSSRRGFGNGETCGIVVLDAGICATKEDAERAATEHEVGS